MSTGNGRLGSLAGGVWGCASGPYQATPALMSGQCAAAIQVTPPPQQNPVTPNLWLEKLWRLTQSIAPWVSPITWSYVAAATIGRIAAKSVIVEGSPARSK